VEFEDGGVREVGVGQLLVGAADADAPADGRAPYGGDVAQRGLPRVEQRATLRDGHVRAKSKQHKMSDHGLRPWADVSGTCRPDGMGVATDRVPAGLEVE